MSCESTFKAIEIKRLQHRLKNECYLDSGRLKQLQMNGTIIIQIYKANIDRRTYQERRGLTYRDQIGRLHSKGGMWSV